MLEFDKAAIEKAGCETVTPVIVSNTGDYKEIQVVTDRKVEALEPVLQAER